MSDNLEVGVVLTADGKGLQGELKKTDKSLKKLDTGIKNVDKDGKRATKTVRALKTTMVGLKTTATGVTRAMTGLTGMFAGLTAIGVGATFISAASTAEQYKVRLNGLLGSQAEGNRLFKEMADYAGKVPFEYEKVMESATQLAGVMEGGVDEIKEWMPLIGDLAAASGLSIQDTTTQVQRMYSSGAASADMFRDRGVLAMLGFKSKTAYTIEETRRMLMDAWNDPESKFKGMANELGKTWSGMMSMIADKWFSIRTTIMDAGLFDYIKDLVGLIDGQFASALDNSTTKAEDWTESLIGGIETILIGLGHVRDFFDTIATGVDALDLAFISGPAAQIEAMGAFLERLKPQNWFGDSRELIKEQKEAAEALAGAQELHIKMLERGNRNRSEEAGLVVAGLRLKHEERKAARAAAEGQDEVADATKNRATQTKGLTDAQKATLKADEKYEQNLIKKYTPAVDELTDAMFDLEDRYQDGRVGIEAYQIGMTGMNAELEELTESSKEAVPELFNLETAYKQIQKNVQNGFSDLFVGVFHGEYLDSIKDFGKEILDIFLKLIADIAAAWVASKIFGGSLNMGSIMGSLGINTATSAATGGAGGIGGAIAGSALGKSVAGWFGGSAAPAAGAAASEVVVGKLAAETITTTGAMGTTAASGAANGVVTGGGWSYAAPATTATGGGTAAPAATGAGLGLTAALGAGGLAIMAFASAANKKRWQDMKAEVIGLFDGANNVINTTGLALADLGQTGGVVLKGGKKDSKLFAAALGEVNAKFNQGADGTFKIRDGMKAVRSMTNGWTSEAVDGMQRQISSLTTQLSLTGQFESRMDALAAATRIVGQEFAENAQIAAGMKAAIDDIPTEIRTLHTIETRRLGERGGGNEGGGGEGFAQGGIAYGPKSGHMELLHGPEAVVPLPDGRTIPVDVRGGGTDMRATEAMLETMIRQNNQTKAEMEAMRETMVAMETSNADGLADLQQQILAGQ